MKYRGELGQVKARVPHICANCGISIGMGEIYYREKAKDVFLQTLHSRPFCTDCYKREGNRLLTNKKKTEVTKGMDRYQRRLA